MVNEDGEVVYLNKATNEVSQVHPVLSHQENKQDKIEKKLRRTMGSTNLPKLQLHEPPPLPRKQELHEPPPLPPKPATPAVPDAPEFIQVPQFPDELKKSLS